ncbi:MAG: hypothetical protein KME31_04145 [Tolypothrix carrinoi HA7290-LM1]|jgi:glucose-6-phosphate 1-dehydrogenase|nr:hypothetical protein [Tolypothrix carrinoi HA7290-LM1]
MTIATAPQSQVESSVHPAEPFVIVIFGAAGDLTKRLLIPALYNLKRSNLLPQEFAIVGIAHTPMSQDDFRSQLNRDIHEFATVAVDDRLWQQIEQRSYYLQGKFQNETVCLRDSSLLLRHIPHHQVHWFCRRCWQDMS